MTDFDPEKVERYSVHITEIMSVDQCDEDYVRMVYADKYDLLLELYRKAEGDAEAEFWAEKERQERDYD